MDLSMRIMSSEQMDDFDITDARLTSTLVQLPRLNKLLGAHAVVTSFCKRVVQSDPGYRDGCRRFSVLDIGSGIGDIPTVLVEWGLKRGVYFDVVATDANPFTSRYAEEYAEKHAPKHVRARLSFEVADALALPFADNSFDYVLATQLVHHFDDPEAVSVIREMARVGRNGLLISDLHRHIVAYHSIGMLARALRMSPMIVSDGPASVLRGFVRDELEKLCLDAGVVDATIRWMPAFRWSVTARLSSDSAEPGTL